MAFTPDDFFYASVFSGMIYTWIMMNQSSDLWTEFGERLKKGITRNRREYIEKIGHLDAFFHTLLSIAYGLFLPHHWFIVPAIPGIMLNFIWVVNHLCKSAMNDVAFWKTKFFFHLIYFFSALLMLLVELAFLVVEITKPQVDNRQT